MARRAARQRNQLPPCYYEGFLEKRSFKDKTSRKLWTCLCGNTLFFFNDKKDSDYIETIDLRNLVSITDDSSQDRNLEAARLNLQLKDGNIKFTVPSAEARELWKGFINSVCELSVPSSLNLLPGQIHMLKEAVEQEKERLKAAPPCTAAASGCSPYVSLEADMPGCYHNVSRYEAELLLEKEAEKGNLLLRPGRSGSSFAITTRQDLDGSVFKHYRVTRKPEGGFIIDLNDPIPCATLHDVVSYLVENTDGVLIPLIIEEPYDKSISFIRADNENGETSIESIQVATSKPPPDVPPKPVGLKLPRPEPAPVPVDEEPIYMNANPEALEVKPKGALAPPAPEINPRKKAALNPVPAPRRMPSASLAPCIPSSAGSADTRMRTQSDSRGQITTEALSELKLKLGQKLKTQ